MTSSDAQYQRPGRSQRRLRVTEPFCGMLPTTARRLTHCFIALLVIGSAVAGCSSGNDSQPAASGSSVSKAASTPGASAQPSTTTHPAGVGGQPIKVPGKRHVKLVLNNGTIPVCSLITGQQVNQIMHQEFPRPVPVAVGTFDECATTRGISSSTSSSMLRVAWANPPESKPELAFKQMTIKLPRSDAVTGLGSQAYCSNRGISSQLFVIDGHAVLEVFADTCDHATALARIAIRRL
jgi:hypothetical protein